MTSTKIIERVRKMEDELLLIRKWISPVRRSGRSVVSLTAGIAGKRGARGTTMERKLRKRWIRS